MRLALQLGSVLLISGIYLGLFSDMAESTQYAICFAAILIFGIPHGAVDHIVYAGIKKISRKNSDRIFITKYLLLMAAYLLVWLFYPFKALVIFILMGAYHFGQEFFEEHLIEVKNRLSFFIWGGLVLIFPLIVHYPATVEFVLKVTRVSLPEMSAEQGLILSSVIVIFNLGYFAFLRMKGAIDRSRFWKILAQITVLVLVFISMPFIIGFTLYFVIFHSLNAMHHQYSWLTNLRKVYKPWHYFKDLSPLTLVSYAGVLFMLFYFDFGSWQNNMLYFLIFISMLTLPHMIVFEDFYYERRQYIVD